MRHGHQQDFDVSTDRPALDVLIVSINACGHRFNRIGAPAQALDLGQTGEAGAGSKAQMIVGDLGAVLLIMRQGVWTRADDRHVAAQNINKLGKLVDAGLADDLAERREPIVVALGLALAIQAFLIKPYRIPSESMVPTLQVGQRVLVNRLGNRFNAPKGTWYKGVKWRPLTDKGEPIIPVVSVNPAAVPKFGFGLQMVGNALSGHIDADYSVSIQDVQGKVVERFSGRAGKVEHALATSASGMLTLKISTSRGTESARVLREIR